MFVCNITFHWQQVYGVKISLKKSQNDNELVYPDQMSGLWTPYDCFFNPVASAEYRAEDCETLYSFCHPATDERCDWKLTPKYEECFSAREAAWARRADPAAAAAITTIKDCKMMDTRRKKVKCLNMVKAHLKTTQVEPREMLEELLELRDMWLDDDVFDEEEE